MVQTAPLSKASNLNCEMKGKLQPSLTGCMYVTYYKVKISYEIVQCLTVGKCMFFLGNK